MTAPNDDRLNGFDWLVLAMITITLIALITWWIQHACDYGC